MEAACQKCGKFEWEYEVPEYWCRYCWCDWWFLEDQEVTEELKRERRNPLRRIQRKYGKARKYERQI